MSHDHLIPPGVAESDAALLRRAYTLESHDNGAELYSEWAETYDRTMLDGLGYLSPRLLVDLFAKHVPTPGGSLLDIGCGTGLVGEELAARGFTVIDGLDLSLEMMEVAGRRGVYRRFLAGDLNAPLDIADFTYAAVICTGTFTSGHVGAGCLSELVRVIEPGGVLCCSVHDAVWDTLGFGAGLAQLIADGRIAEVEVRESPFYESSTEPDGRLCLFRVVEEQRSFVARTGE